MKGMNEIYIFRICIYYYFLFKIDWFVNKILRNYDYFSFRILFCDGRKMVILFIYFFFTWIWMYKTRLDRERERGENKNKIKRKEK